MIDFTTVAKVETGFVDVRTFHEGDVVDILKRGEVTIVANGADQRVCDEVAVEWLSNRCGESGIDEGVSEAVETHNQFIGDALGGAETVVDCHVAGLA